METVHELKVWPEFFHRLWTGEKTFELRKDDRGFKAGDALWLREWEPKGQFYTGHWIRADVTYLCSGMGLERDYVCMALRVDVRERADI